MNALQSEISSHLCGNLHAILEAEFIYGGAGAVQNTDGPWPI